MTTKTFLMSLIIAIFVLPSYAAEVKTRKTEGGWELLVDGTPYFVKGVCYYPDTLGESGTDNTRRNWKMVDDDKDGRNDFAYQTWVDQNRNNVKDPDEKETGDFQLMKDMGVNTIRVYHHVSDDPVLQSLNINSSKALNYPPELEKKILNELYKDFGIMTAMGDLLGAYTVATGADWNAGTDYTDPVQRANMLRSVEEMVREHKDEPYILMWVLGNENNLPFPHTQAASQPVEFAKFVNEAAELIKKLDNNRHPVAIANGGAQFIEQYAAHAPAIDIFGLNLYQNSGFHELWKKTAMQWDRPVMLTEFGTMHPIVVNGKLNEKYQAQVHRKNWEDIARHRAGSQAPGNAIGGFAFTWTDNWWEDGDPTRQNLNPDGSGWNHEYNGITSQGNDISVSLIRQLREVYFMYQELWKND